MSARAAEGGGPCKNLMVLKQDFCCFPNICLVSYKCKGSFIFFIILIITAQQELVALHFFA